MAAERNRRKTKVGVVVSDKMDKTVVVAIEEELWRQDLFQEIRDGDLSTLLKKLSKEAPSNDSDRNKIKSG